MTSSISQDLHSEMHGKAFRLPTTVIDADCTRRMVDWQELRQYRDLFRFLVWREIKVRYAQSALGIGWAIIQPLFSMLVFTIVFGKLAAVSSDGAPYALFSFAALVPWTYFANSVTEGTNILVSNATMISKIYFPRILLPMSAVAAKLLDFAIAFIVLLVLLVAFRVTPNIGVLVIPWLVVMMVTAAGGLSAWLTALAIQYRDVKHGVGFGIQLLMYGAPVVYPASLIPDVFRPIYALNPMVGVIEGFRSALLGTTGMPWDLIGIGTISTFAIAISGLAYFRKSERVFADVA